MSIVDSVGRFFVSSWSDEPAIPELSGFAITDQFVVRGTDGLHAYLNKSFSAESLREGRFIGVFEQDDRWHIRTDLAGQELAYFYQSGSNWAVSNSLLMIARRVRDANLSLTMNPHQFGVSPIGGYGSQPLTLATAFSEVFLLLPSETVVLEKRSRAAFVTRQTHTNALQSVFSKDQDYSTALKTFVNDSLATASALVAGAEDISIDLSGGYDSRLSVSLFHKVSPSFDHIYLRSNHTRTEDYEVAQSVMSALGYQKPSEKSQWQKMSGEWAFSLWLDGSAGGYLPIREHTQQLEIPIVRVTGDLSASAKYSRISARANIRRSILTHQRTRQKLGYSRETSSLRRGIGRVRRRNEGPFLYALTRSRFHCGRDWYRRLSRQAFHTPLASARFSHLYLLAGRDRINPLTVLADLQSLVNQEIMPIPHSEKRRQWSMETISARLASPRFTPEFDPKHILGAIQVPDLLDTSSNAETPFRELLLHSFKDSETRLRHSTYPREYLEQAQSQAQQARDGVDLIFLKHLSRAVHFGEMLRYVK